MSRQKRRMASIHAIFDYWSQRGWRGSKHHCMECGVECRPERAHIVARCKGGSDSAENLVLVCHMCHVMTDGRTMERWEQKLIGDGIGSLTVAGFRMTFEFLTCLAQSEGFHAKEVMRLLFDGDEE